MLDCRSTPAGNCQGTMATTSITPQAAACQTGSSALQIRQRAWQKCKHFCICWPVVPVRSAADCFLSLTERERCVLVSFFCFFCLLFLLLRLFLLSKGPRCAGKRNPCDSRMCNVYKTDKETNGWFGKDTGAGQFYHLKADRRHSTGCVHIRVARIHGREHIRERRKARG